MAISRQRIFIFSAVFLFVLQFFPQGASSNGKPNKALLASRGRLINHLLATYNRLVIPSTDEAIKVEIEFTIHNIELDEQKRKFTIDGYFSRRWDDVSLRWNASDFSNIQEIRIPIRNLWSPDVVLYNHQGLTNPSMPHDDAVVYSSGNVLHVPRITDSAVCGLDMSKFPFDVQTCKLMYGSWVYSSLQLNISSTSSPVISENFELSEKWEIISTKSEVESKHYACCPESYETYIMTFVLRRHFVYSCQVLIFPAIIIAALIPFMFLLPSESKERITLGIALVVISVMQINVINNSLPKGYSTIPVILKYHVLTLILVALSVILSIFILNIYNRGPRRKKMPQILRTIFLKGLRKLVCLGDDTYNPTDEQETMSMRGKDVVVGVDDEKPPQTSGGNMDEINKHMQSLAQRDSVLDARQEILAEWQQMAMVIDRIMFILFLIIFVISTISIFPDASYKGIEHGY